jgi:serine/threonine protein kinase
VPLPLTEACGALRCGPTQAGWQADTHSGLWARSFTVSRLQNIARQTLEALSYLQSLTLLHNDLKPENILVKDVERADIKIIDFGSAW